MSDAQYCPRAVMEGRGGPHSPFKAPFNGEMTWRNDGTCSWCGSLSGDALMARLEAGDVELTPTDKSYKVYVRNVGGEAFKQSVRECPVHPCPDVTDAEGNVNVNNCSHYVMRETSDAKFYFQHFTKEQQARFIELYNTGKIKMGYPGHFYTAPYFCVRVPAAPTPDDGA